MPATERKTINRGAISRALNKKKARKQKRKVEKQSSGEAIYTNETRIDDSENELKELGKEKQEWGSTMSLNH